MSFIELTSIFYFCFCSLLFACSSEPPFLTDLLTTWGFSSSEDSLLLLSEEDLTEEEDEEDSEESSRIVRLPRFFCFLLIFLLLLGFFFSSSCFYGGISVVYFIPNRLGVRFSTFDATFLRRMTWRGSRARLILQFGGSKKSSSVHKYKSCGLTISSKAN